MSVRVRVLIICCQMYILRQFGIVIICMSLIFCQSMLSFDQKFSPVRGPNLMQFRTLESPEFILLAIELSLKSARVATSPGLYSLEGDSGKKGMSPKCYSSSKSSGSKKGGGGNTARLPT